MSTPESSKFQEAILLADYAIKTALVEMSVLDQSSINTLQSASEYSKEIVQVMQHIELANKSLHQARKVTGGLILKCMEIA